MRILLLVGKASTSHEVVAAEATELRAQGHHVALATRVAPRDVLTAAVDEVVVLTPTLPAPPAPAARASSRTAPAVARGSRAWARSPDSTSGARPVRAAVPPAPVSATALTVTGPPGAAVLPPAGASRVSGPGQTSVGVADDSDSVAGRTVVGIGVP